MAKFDKFIHVTQEVDGDDVWYSVTRGKAEDALTESSKKTTVATYELKEVKEGKLEPVFSTIVG